MEIKPLGNRVLVKPHNSEENSGGIIVPGRQKNNRADVIAVGPGYRLSTGEYQPPQVKEGDIIIMPQYGGVDVKQEGERAVLINASDIVAVVEEG